MKKKTIERAAVNDVPSLEDILKKNKISKGSLTQKEYSFLQNIYENRGKLVRCEELQDISSAHSNTSPIVFTMIPLVKKIGEGIVDKICTVGYTMGDRYVESYKKEVIVVANGFDIYPASYSISIDNKKIGMNKTEFELLHYLAKNPNRIVSKENIIKDVWKIVIEPDIVNVYLTKLRKTLGPYSGLLETHKNEGFMLRMNAA
jgi:DNA-binding winged helix-turn-helix (wHTH) protein